MQRSSPEVSLVHGSDDAPTTESHTLQVVTTMALKKVSIFFDHVNRTSLIFLTFKICLDSNFSGLGFLKRFIHKN